MATYLHVIVAMVVIAFAVDSMVTDASMEEKGMPVTDALKEKFGIIFDLIDINKDGLYSVDDEFGFAERLIDHYNASGELAENFMHYALLYKDVIEAYYGADTTKTTLTRSEYVKAHGWYWIHHYDMFRQRLVTWFTTIFHAVDSDNKCGISFREFQDAYDIYGNPFSVKNKSRSAFNLFDADGNGFIHENEFLDIHLKFHFDPDITAKELPLY